MNTWAKIKIRKNREEAERPTVEVMVARVLKVNPNGPIGRRMVKRALCCF